MRAKQSENELVTLMAGLQEKAVLEMVGQRLAEGTDPLEIIDLCHQGMILVGERYEQKLYFISGLIMAGEIMRQVSQQVLPLLGDESPGELSEGTIVLGTVEGDIHFIGKDIFKVLARVHGFKVHDLGTDVPPAAFLDAVREIRPDIVGFSCLISAAYQSVADTIAMLRQEVGAADAPRSYLIGGRVDDLVCQDVGADHWTKDGMRGVRVCQEIMAVGRL